MPKNDYMGLMNPSDGSFWDKYSGAINNLIGNISDITRYNNYVEAADKLREFKDRYDRMNKVNSIKRKLMQTDSSLLPQYSEEEKPVINNTWLEYLPADQYPDEVKNWADYVDMIKDDKTKTIPGLDEYLTTLGIKEDFAKRYPQSFTNVKQQIPLTQDELEQKYYEMAGLTPEDVAFYKQYMNENLDEHNRGLKQFITDVAGGLRSMGSAGDMYLQALTGQSGMLQIPEIQPTKYTVIHDVKNGNLIYINPLDPNDRKIVKYANTDKLPTDEDWEIFEDADGNPYWGERVFKDGKWKIEKRDDLNKKESEDYEIYKQKRDKTGVYQYKKTGRGRFGTGSKGVDYSKWEQSKFGEITSADLDKMKPYDLINLQKYQFFLNEDVRDKLVDILTGIESGNDIDVKDAYSGTPDPETGYDDAQANVNVWISEITGMWGRNDLTKDEWRSEIGKHWGRFNYIEQAIIEEMFKDQFGEEL